MPGPDHDLSAHAAVLGNPADYFVSSAGRPKPLVVRHADGEPVFIIEADGSLTPYGAPAPPAPAPPVVGDLDHRADPARFSDS